MVAVAGASAGGYASAAKPHTFPASFTASSAAAGQANDLADGSIETAADLTQGRRAGVQRAIASAQQAKARAAALARVHAAAVVQARLRADAAAAAVATQARAREMAALRSSRDAIRQSLVARAQSDPMSAARQLAADRGWGSEQFDCLSRLWTKESGWRWDANNPSSDAYGIPQALPGSKMASSGSDWETNPTTQIKWGLEYISSTYGTPCSAWAKSRASNWY